MTPQQKAKAYDEAINKAEALYKAAQPMSGCNVIIETIFPELKKLDEEIIREEITTIIKRYVDDSHKLKRKMIAWVKTK